ncbi:tRNA (cytidine(34)-2'-O)-methyltransferase [Corynebacterium sp. 320]|uniref:tRNA (cytidine(34)-2'-O)-methyltransferase n=1 Tax=Corynebacterium TaxID=1716 RepID=UPI00125CCD74|nr:MULTISPECIES: tRNA (cytidine(34)-2'-O)-methyltransferase [Corynebacterium]KAB1504223.1 tRNA (cytidine(34)-2'-O)-methyltransferase [Corynebacterium sp. 320]KAB1552677.1 tRNA (cytidine(34)-2'-O)-methyltransferase [Corynebacterium sp. 321]KAB1554105.1 tRNA (cytidine(34)-2'-O)-methyltransferase [Corynebacterium sp. 319]KAB3528359.1 tRNA (cytidine(34)-2'-O)-methyltransferase [Corynebacterium sp. 250]KAB3540151.1 tRNA (cytidine(34)-2'-O)-methyltransferase [Corynebacterium sp. 366]
MTTPPFHIVFDQPQIPQNTGNAIRLAACTGAVLHLARPYLFDFQDKNLKRAGLDYHDLAVVEEHDSLDEVLTQLADQGGARVFAFSSHATTPFTDVEFQAGDVLLFGCESDGLSQEALADPRITQQVRIPMLPARRSMNLANCASIAAYEAWRQLGYPGGS